MDFVFSFPPQLPPLDDDAVGRGSPKVALEVEKSTEYLERFCKEPADAFVVLVCVFFCWFGFWFEKDLFQ